MNEKIDTILGYFLISNKTYIIRELIEQLLIRITNIQSHDEQL